MSHPNKVKGTRWESEVVEYLSDEYPDIERRSLKGNADKGDIVNVPGWVLECKNEQRINLGGYMDESEAEARNAKVPWFAAIVKRRRKNVSQAYVVMPLFSFKALLRALAYGKAR